MKLNTKFPFFLFLLPIFFFLHGLNENFVPELLVVAVLLTLIYTAIGWLITGVTWFALKKNIRKAALLAFWLLSFNFFFGAMHDFARAHFPSAFFTRYSIIIPAVFILTIVLFIWLRKTKKNLFQVTMFLNLVFIVLVIMDGITLGKRYIENRSSRDVTNLVPSFIDCDTCSKPDIYLIVPDEYAGHRELKELCDFDNSFFEDALRSRGFHVLDSSVSNYNATIYSMASILSMDYIKNLNPAHINARDMQVCQQFIRKNNFVRFVKSQGYSIVNHSYFDLDTKKKAVYNPFYPTSQSLFIHQTFTRRFQKNIGHTFLSEKDVERIIKYHLYNNRETDSLARVTASSNTSQPKFVYVHFEMPHHPYYFDSTGKEYPYMQLTDSFTMDRKAYVQYIAYANKKLLSLVDHIKASSKQPPIIILLSDHGLRQLAADVPHEYYFMNMGAVFLPGQDYSRFYPGISNVNVLRTVLNTQFHQRLPLLKDSTSFLNVPMRTF
jgi:hypothetical protein